MECPTNRETERERVNSTPKLIQRRSHLGPRRSNQKNEHVMNDCNIALCEPLTIFFHRQYAHSHHWTFKVPNSMIITIHLNHWINPVKIVMERCSNCIKSKTTI